MGEPKPSKDDQRQGNRRRSDHTLPLIAADVELLKERHEEMKREFANARIAIEANHLLTKEIKCNTDEIVKQFKERKARVAVMVWAARGLRWIGKNIVLPACILYGGLYALTHHGQIPPWLKELTAFME